MDTTTLNQEEKNALLGLVRLGLDSAPDLCYEFAVECSKKLHGNWAQPPIPEEVWHFLRGLWDSGASPLTYQNILVKKFNLPVSHARAAVDAFVDMAIEEEM